MRRDWAVWLVLLVGWLVILTQAFDLYPLDADEASDALAVYDVLDGKWPVWLATQHRHASLKAYFDAPLVAWAGPQDWTLRVSSLLLRLLEPPMMLVTAWLLLGRRAALAAGLLAALWPGRLHFWLLGSQGGATATFCGYALLLALAWGVRRRPTTAWLGLAAGLGLWNGFQSVSLIGPVVLAYFLATRARWQPFVLPFGLGSAPFWLDGLRHGFFRDNGTYLAHNFATGNEGLPAWFIPWDNWRYYVTTLFYESFSFENLSHLGWEWFATLGSLAVWAALVGGFLGFLRALSRLRGQELVFWTLVVLVPILLWALGVGFSTPGRWRGWVHRFIQPFWFLAPLWIPLAAGRSRAALVLVTALLCLPATQELAHLGHAHPSVKRNANVPDLFGTRAEAWEAQLQLREAVRRAGVTWVMGSWWEAGDQEFFSRAGIGCVSLDPGFGVMVLPRAIPEPGAGLLVLFRGQPLERFLLEQDALVGLRELPGPRQYRLVLVPEQSRSVFQQLFRYWRQTELVLQGRAAETELLPGLGLGEGARREPDFSLTSSRSHARLTGGPTVRVTPGLYEVEFRLEGTTAATNATGFLDLSTEMGEKRLWEEPFELSGRSPLRRHALLRLDRDCWLLTRVLLTEVEGGAVRLTSLVLRRLADPSQAQAREARRLAWAKAREDFSWQWERLGVAERTELDLLPTLRGHAAELGVLEPGPPVSLEGPDRELPPGRYRLEVTFGAVPADLVVEARVVGCWHYRGPVRPGETLRGEFKLTAPTEVNFELALLQASGPVTVSAVRLKR